MLPEAGVLVSFPIGRLKSDTAAAEAVQRDAGPEGGSVAREEYQAIAERGWSPDAEGIRRAARRPAVRVSDRQNHRSPVLEVSNLIKLAKALDCSVDELLAGVDPDYDRIRGGFDIAVVAEGDVLPSGNKWDEGEQQRPPILEWLARPGDLRDPSAYGVRIRGDSMIPAFRPNMTVIVSPESEVRDGDEVYVQLASGECLVRLLRTSRTVTSSSRTIRRTTRGSWDQERSRRCT